MEGARVFGLAFLTKSGASEQPLRGKIRGVSDARLGGPHKHGVYIWEMYLRVQLWPCERDTGEACRPKPQQNELIERRTTTYHARGIKSSKNLELVTNRNTSSEDKQRTQQDRGDSERSASGELGHGCRMREGGHLWAVGQRVSLSLRFGPFVSACVQLSDARVLPWYSTAAQQALPFARDNGGISGSLGVFGRECFHSVSLYL